MQIPTMPQILESIEAFLKRHDMPPSTFGREATGEPQLIKSMREGRSPSHRVLERISSFMAEHEQRLLSESAEGSSDKALDSIASAPDQNAIAGGVQA